jgi:hypothetical protein
MRTATLRCVTEEPAGSDEHGSGPAQREDHLRRRLHNYTTHTTPAQNIDSYAERVYQANRAAGL